MKLEPLAGGDFRRHLFRSVRVPTTFLNIGRIFQFFSFFLIARMKESLSFSLQDHFLIHYSSIYGNSLIHWTREWPVAVCWPIYSQFSNRQTSSGIVYIIIKDARIWIDKMMKHFWRFFLHSHASSAYRIAYEILYAKFSRQRVNEKIIHDFVTRVSQSF